MSAKATFIGRVANLNYVVLNTKNGPTPKLEIQIICDDSYSNSAGVWVKKSSSFFIAAWGPYAQKLHENKTLEVGFGLVADAKMVVNVKKDVYYTDIKLEGFEITSRPKSWHDRRNNAIQNQQQEIYYPPYEPENQPQQQSVPPINPNDQPDDDDIPF